MWLRQKEFEGANNSGRFLAWQLKKRREKKIITRININNKIATDQKGIKKAFLKYYTKFLKTRKIKKRRLSYISKH